MIIKSDLYIVFLISNIIRCFVDGIIKSKKGRLLTRRHNSVSGEEHGIGLLSVRKAIEKYHGNMDISYDDKEFTIDIILYSNKT